MRMFLALILLAVVIAFGEAPEERDGMRAERQLRVGFGQVDITPPIGATITGPGAPASTGTDDPLFVKALVAQSGDRTLAVVGLDLVKVTRELADAAITEASQRTGIARDAILICPSHNHSSPLIPAVGDSRSTNHEYISTLPGRIADGIEQAYKAMKPANMLLGRSIVLEGHHNRRVMSKADGLVLNTWLKKLNNLDETPQVLGTEGPIDPELWVARFDALDGQVLGTLVNFTCHPSLHDRIAIATWSADYPGVIADQLAQEYGKQAVCVFTQGAAGNIAPTVQFTPDWKERAAVFAKAALDAAKRATPVQEPMVVNYARRDVDVPCRDPAEQRDGAITRLGWRPDMFDAAKRMAAAMPRVRTVPVSAARIGPLGIATNAGELFVEWGISVKRRSPFRHTILCELTNDWVGYEPTALAMQNEGYETLAGVDFISLKGIEMLVDTAVVLLESLWEKDGR